MRARAHISSVCVSLFQMCFGEYWSEDYADSALSTLIRFDEAGSPVLIERQHRTLRSRTPACERMCGASRADTLLLEEMRKSTIYPSATFCGVQLCPYAPNPADCASGCSWIDRSPLDDPGLIAIIEHRPRAVSPLKPVVIMARWKVSYRVELWEFDHDELGCQKMCTL